MKTAWFDNAALAAASLVLLGCAQDSGANSRGVQIGKPVPEYAAVSLAGDSVSLAGQRGKVVLLNVWATWCHPCRAEIPELRQIHESYQARGLELLGVSIDADGSEEAIREFADEFQMQYPIWLDPGERISARFLIVGVPESFLIDRNGILLWRKIGPIAPRDTTLTSAIERALAG